MSDSASDNQDSASVLVGVTGSVAAIKVPELVQKLLEISSIKLDVQVVATKSALHFFEPSALPVKYNVDEEEWLRKWADLLVIAPLDANTMAKMATGICDNLLTCVVRAWDPKKPLLFCPAMNTFMWEHPLTASQITTLTQFGYVQVPPVSKTLACGDQGIGAMALVDDIVRRVLDSLRTSV